MTQFPAVFNLPSVNGINGFRLSGRGAYDGAGHFVGYAGDVNGDGFADLMVLRSTGTSVVFGSAAGFPADTDLGALNGADGFTITGVPLGGSARGPATAGDINGDGYDDIVLGFPGASQNRGVAYVVFGKASGFGSTFDVSSLNGSNGFALTGHGGGDYAGVSVASAGDVNGDGFADVIVSSIFAHTNGQGASYVVFGKASGFPGNLDLSTLNGANGFKISAGVGVGATGWSVDGAGDVNGDGFDDLVIGALGASPNGPFSGASFVVFGKASGFAANLDLSSLNGSNGFAISGAAAHDGAGYSVAAAGDVNGDGFNDVIIGAYHVSAHGKDSGAAYVVFGGPTGFAANINLSSLDGSNGFELTGGAEFDRAGRDVSSAGDINGDGLADVMVGAAGVDSGSPRQQSSGAAYVVYGQLPDTAVNRTGSAASQSLVGGNFTDTLSGLGGDDRLFGHGGDDQLNGGAGNDTIDGGPGEDSAVFSGARASYSISTDSAGVTTVTDLRSGSPDGTDAVKNVEHLQFTDQVVDLQVPLSLAVGAPTRQLTEAGLGTAGVTSAISLLTLDGFGATPAYVLTGWTPLGGGLYGLSGIYGTATLDQAANTLSYSLDNTRAATNALAAGQSVNDVINLTVTDGVNTLVVPATFVVNGTNDAPTPGADAIPTPFNVPISVSAASLLANDSDPEGAALTLTAVGGALNGTVTLNAGQVTFTPVAGFFGPASFTYTVIDGQGGSAVGAVTVNVAPPSGAAPAYINHAGVTAPETIDLTVDGGYHQVITGSGDTTVFTGSGGSSVRLGAGDDVVIGGAGKDTITFGPGLGTVTGGTGPDVFILVKNQIADPAAHAGQYDTVTDFTGAGVTYVAGRDFVYLKGFSGSATVTYEHDLAGDPTAHLYRVDDGGYHAEFVLDYAGAGVDLSHSQYGFL